MIRFRSCRARDARLQVGATWSIVPNPIASDVERARFFHEDLEEMEPDELFVAKLEVDLQLALTDGRDKRWLFGRRGAILAQLARCGLKLR